MISKKDEIDDWELKMVQTRYKATYDLAISLKQARLIYFFEKERDTYSDKTFFSVWEEWDYELSTLKEILNHKQFKEYEKTLKENIRRYEEGLVESDKETANDIRYNEDLIKFYETKFLPDFFKSPFIRAFDLLPSEKTKIEYLRSEYKSFLNESKKQILANHFRYNRTFKPSELRLSLLKLKLSYIFPDCMAFEYQMDEPTKAVAQYIKAKFLYLPEELEELLNRKFSELKKFEDENFKKYYGSLRGWHVVIGQPTEKEEREYRIMLLVLLDKENTISNILI